MCHTDAGKHGLSLDALTGDPNTVAEQDRRASPRSRLGACSAIPSSWIPPGHGPGSPEQAMQAPLEGATGLLIDPWVLPN